MKRQRLLLLLPLLSLAACGETGPTPDDYFDAFALAGKKQLEGDTVSMRSTGAVIDTHFLLKEEDKEERTPVGIKLSPLNLDFRISGLHETDIRNVIASLQTRSPNGNASRVYITGIDTPSVTKLSDGGFALSPNVYLDGARMYLDLQDAAVIPVALKAISEDFKDFPLRGYSDLSEEAITDINKELPLDDYFPKAVERMKTELKRSYESAPDAFTFLTKGETRAISFATTSWSNLRSIVDSFLAEERSSLSASYSSIDVSSIMDEAEKNATLRRFNLSMEFSETALSYIDVDVAFSFTDIEREGDFVPTGDWEFKGTMEFGSLSPVTLSTRDKNRYTEIVWPTKDEPQA